MSIRSLVALMALVFSMILIAAGCGDDDTTADDAADAPAATTDGDAGESAGGDASPSAGEPGTGTITVGDLAYDLEVTRCVTIAGAIAAGAVAVDEPDNVDVTISLSPEDWRDRSSSEGWTANGSVRLDIDDPYQQWEAGVEALEFYNLPDGSTLEDFTIESYDVSDDDQSVQGEASFASIDALLLSEPLEPTPGSFAITCPET